ncbi:putative phage abortive infection protein [Ureibacillus sinduriensis]|uniref:Phage abortive infection protein n=1 Tax=Ureibacillus sinduriensis BLB-1 = JCM 15800 TaxID=1384057 RepID=A0A0A3HXF3_9BACL|nr:putative phage abortive infection protein [Ureibacillus sinduriensis]KGR75053.1 hypothetical protein CD33_12290 [Ureibacillus sinduriensis BLB-1 = JCM 15800]
MYIVNGLLIFIVIIIVYFYINFETEKDVSKNNKEFDGWIKTAVISVGLGGLLLITLIALNDTSFEFLLNKLKGMGEIGDVIGGSTVAFFNFGSFLILMATFKVQQKELSLQRNELIQARKEYAITNQTLKKQQFETTFFHMVGLHHQILSDMSLDEKESRELIKNLFFEFKFKSHKAFIEYKLNNELSYEQIKIMYEEISVSDFENDIKVKMGLNTYYIDAYLSELNNNPNSDRVPYNFKEFYEEHLKTDEHLLKDNLEEVKNRILKAVVKGRYFSPYFNTIKNKEKWNSTKIHRYTKFYTKYEYLIGHYYRNLYRIIKFINETELLEKEERKEYRGILRAQLSSYELMMLFYNVMYSEKGKRFKDQLKGLNFFDNHLLENEWIWLDDEEKIVELENV